MGLFGGGLAPGCVTLKTDVWELNWVTQFWERFLEDPPWAWAAPLSGFVAGWGIKDHEESTFPPLLLLAFVLPVCRGLFSPVMPRCQAALPQSQLITDRNLHRL